MKNKWIIALVISIICSLALADSNETLVQKLTKHYAKLMQQSRQQYIDQTNAAAQATLNSTTSNNNTDSDSDNTDNNKQQKQTKKTKKKKSIPVCDCYKMSVNENNDPNNFLYDASHIRVKRLYPACICEPHKIRKKQSNDLPIANISSQTNSSSTENNNDNTQNTDQTSSDDSNNSNYNFGISYN